MTGFRRKNTWPTAFKKSFCRVNINNLYLINSIIIKFMDVEGNLKDRGLVLRSKNLSRGLRE